jgi:glycosyltransferase involved in cell wall biosynthesis
VNVLHLIGGGELGGAEQHIITLLPRLQTRGVQPLLACLYKHAPLTEKIRSTTAPPTPIPTDLFPMRAPFDLSPLPRLLKYCTRHKIDLIHCHGLRANIIGRAASLISRLPAITTWHSWPEQDFPGALTGKIAMTLEHMTLGLSAGSITVSHALADKLQQWPPMERQKTSKKNRFHQTIYNGYTPLQRTPEEHAQARQDYRGLWHIPENAVVLGSVGRLHPVKGHLYLLEAASLLASRFPALHVLLIGEGPERSSLEQQLINAPYTYTLAGHLPNAERALPAIDMFVFPSLHEGMGIALLEAIQANLPIVATAVGGIPEILRAGTDALLVPPADANAIADACQRLLENPAHSQALTAAAQERLALFNPEDMADQTVAFYRQILY